jgi:hypothetical protein
MYQQVQRKGAMMTSNNNSPTSVLEGPAPTTTQASKPVPGARSHEDVTALWYIVVFFLLGLFAAVFITIGVTLWS